MNKLVAVLAAICIIFGSIAALSEPLDDEFAHAFADYPGDPFEDFEVDLDDDTTAPVEADDPFNEFVDDGENGAEFDPFSDFAGSDEELPSYPSDGQDDTPADPTPAPAAPDASLSGEMTLPLPSGTLALSFDPTTEYSVVEKHLVEAAFYAYDNPNSTLYEVFLMFPDDVTEGLTITPEYAMTSAVDTAIGLVISTRDQDTYYVASQQSTTGPYPETSTYSLHFDTISRGAATTTYTGTFSATLVSLSLITGEVDQTLNVDGATFSFTIGNDNSAPEGSDDLPENPFGDFGIEPDLVTPTPAPDYRRV